MLPKDLARLVPKSHLMTESEWRAIGVQQSRGWVSVWIFMSSFGEDRRNFPLKIFISTPSNEDYGSVR